MKQCISVLLLLVGCAQASMAQVLGCTDIQATNYNASATVNDGSCTYPATVASAMPIVTLQSTLNENSALLNVAGKLYTVNDGGNYNEVLLLDTLSGAVAHRSKVLQSTNVDWEAMAASGTNIYIGDIGNNAGNRSNLRIYKLPSTSLILDSVACTSMNYTYEDQTAANINFDCEAMLAVNDSLYLFTKQWSNKWCKQYVLPHWQQTDTARWVDSMYTGCYISDIAIAQNGRVAMLGYDSSGNGFLWLLWQYTGHKFFSGNKRLINLGFSVGQAEGICFAADGTLLVTCESLSVFPARLFRLDVRHIFEIPTGAAEWQECATPFVAAGEVTVPPCNGTYTIRYFCLSGKELAYGAYRQVPAWFARVTFTNGRSTVLRN